MRVHTYLYMQGFPGGSAGKESTCNAGDLGSIPGSGKIPWRRERLLTPVFWPREFYGLYSPWGRKESDMTERLSLLHIYTKTSMPWFLTPLTLQLRMAKDIAILMTVPDLELEGVSWIIQVWGRQWGDSWWKLLMLVVKMKAGPLELLYKLGKTRAAKPPCCCI